VNNIEYIERSTGAIQQEIVPGEKWLKWLYHNPIGKLALHSVVKRKFLSSWYGQKMSTSRSCEKIQSFVDSLNIDMDEAERPVEDYSSFNDFFIRSLKSNARPINTDPNAIVSPADGKILAFEGISGLDSFFIKGQSFSLHDFLQDASLAHKYNNGVLLIIRLAPVDYHRFHFPAHGHISGSQRFEGKYYSVSPYAVKNNVRVYWENKREYSVLKTPNAGDIILCEVGATMVGSIVQNYKSDTNVTKGQEKGWFLFGGSTVVMLFEEGKTQIDSDIISNTRKGFETSIKMGEQIAIATS